jgi:anti-sigma B factor antagonist
VLTVVGTLDAVSAPLPRAALDKALVRAGARRVVVDLLGVSLLASAGLAALTQAGQQAVHQSGPHQPLRVVVDHDRREQLRPIFTGNLDQVLTLHRSVAAALTI